MPGKRRVIHSIDMPRPGAFDAGADLSGATTTVILPPAAPTIGAPYNLSLTTAIERNAVTPTSQIGATWLPPYGANPASYAIQWSTNSSFVQPGTGGAGTIAPSATISGLTPSTLYYVRVAGLVANVQGAWSATASIVTAADTTAPNPVTGQAAVFVGIGDLYVSWTNPSSANYRDTEIKILASSGGATLATLYAGMSPLYWSAAENLAATSGAGDPSVYVELRARSWGGIFSTAVNTGTVTKAAPAAPTVTVDFTGPDAVYTITPPSDAAQISFVANTAITARRLGVVGRYVYTFDTNRLDNTTPDPTLAYSFTAIDGLNQASSATSGTATNAAPSAPTVTLIGGQNQIVATVTSAPAADFLAYEYVFKKDGSTMLTTESAQAQAQYAAQAGDEGVHSWTVTVRQKDVFLQYSTTTTPAAVILDALTTAYLREGLIYSDSVGNTTTALAVLKDDIKDSGGISYNA